jgi:hypothetical protein
MRVAFFHGLESNPYSEKNIALDAEFEFVYAPPMDYRDKNLFSKVLKEVQSGNFDLLIGSSMGGWFAYNVSTITGTPCLLFNPAVQGRSFDPTVSSGTKRAKHTIVLGKEDEVIDPNKTITWFSKNGIGSQTFTWENMEHRIPISVFKKWLSKGSRLNEEWATDAPGAGADMSFMPDTFGTSQQTAIIPEALATHLVPNFLTARPPVGNLTVEDRNELSKIQTIQKSLTQSDYTYIQDCNDSPPDIFYRWLVLRGEKPSMKELNALWKDPSNIKLVDDIKNHFKRPRPYEKFQEVQLAPGITTHDYSFPSGHACGSMYIACKLAKKYPHLSDGLMSLANNIANTRVQAGVHYPSDVEAGKVIGRFLAEQ